MKKNKLFITLASVSTLLTLQSCLDYDVTGDEFNSTTKNVVQTVTRSNVDSINYKAVIPIAEVQNSLNSLQDPFQIALGGQFAMRGGKAGSMPVEHAYQYQFMLGVDIYAQYSVIPHYNFPYSQVVVKQAYDISPKYYGGAMGSFKEMSTKIVPLLNNKEIDKTPELKALYLLLFDYSAIEVADIYGPFPYNDLKTNKQENPYTYETVESIYKNVAKNIDTIVACLKYFPSKPQDYQEAIKNQLLSSMPLVNDVFNGSYTNLDTWIRFANALKLRMAMHIVKVDPQLAQKWAEEAVANGVPETTDHEVALRPAMLGFSNPMLKVYQWGDAALTASMESLLKSLNHPYVYSDNATYDGEYLFKKNSNKFKNTKTGAVTEANTAVMGMRSGSYPGAEQGYDSGNQYEAFSKINPSTFYNAPLYLMKLSEVCFLRAEGALRGWNMGGSAQQFYEQGIKYAGFEDRQNQATFGPSGKNYYDELVNNYMQLENPIPFTYKDPTGDTEDIESVTKIGVKWNESDSKEIKLEKIITQKYIAGFPYSYEAFVDLRRTGYPKLFEVLYAGDEADGTIIDGEMIRRLYFPDRIDASVKQDINTTGIQALGGPDAVATRLWWDVKGPNF